MFGRVIQREPAARNRKFESISLQRRVCELSVPRRRTLVLFLGWSAIAQIPKLIGRELESTRCVRASCILAGRRAAPHDKRDGLVGYGLDCSQSLGSAAMNSSSVEY